MCRDCEVLHEQLHQQAEIMFGLKRRITILNRQLRQSNQEKAKLLKEKKEKQHYRNGQKRGRSRNG